MKQIISFLLLCHLCVSAQNSPQWMRYPSISPDGSQIAFTYKGDLYKVSSKGGVATQLTFHNAHDYMPVWSKMGDKLAFASNRYGNFDVFTMPANGGEATRLTFHSNDESPYSFNSEDTSILFGALRQDDVKHRQYPHRSQSELYSVPVEGGRISQVFTFPAEYVQSSKDGTKMIYQDKTGGENEWRKHHKSAVTRDIWLYSKENDSHTKITSFEGEDRQPVFSPDEKSMYYLSEKDGSFNVYKKGLSADSPETQLTNFSLHPIRFLSIGNGRLAFGFDGELYTMNEGEEPKKLEVTIRTQVKNNSDKFISINGGIGEMAVSPNGKEIAFIARGEVFVTSVGESFTKRLTNTPETESFVTWTPDGKSVVYSSERDGRWQIFQAKKARDVEPFFYASTLIEETALVSSEVDNYIPKFSPDGKKLAYIEDRRSLVVLDLDTKDKTTLLTPKELFHMRDGDKYFTWSPDSKWLLIDWGKTLSNSEVLLMAADGSKQMNLNQSGYYDYKPKWVNDGKQMIWFSNRNGLKSYATSGRSQSDVYSMYFTQEAWDEANLSDEDYKLQTAIVEAQKKDEKDDDSDKDKKKKNDKDKEEKKEVKALTFDWEQMRDRTKRLTIHSSRLGDAVLSKKGDMLYYLASFEDKANLWSTNLRTKETKMLMKLNTNSGSLKWDDKQEFLYLLSNGKITQLDTKAKKQKQIKINGEMPFDEAAERQAMFDHVWIRTKNIFYEPTFHGIDWEQMKVEYSKYIPHIDNDHEFSEMLSEMLGELNVSHAGSGFRGSQISNGDETASLGIFMNYSYEDDGILIDEIIKGGPLDKAKFNLKPGMVIQKIDGELVSKDQDIARYLNRKSGQFVLLEIYDPSTKKKLDPITVKPITIGAENRLLYERWVKINEKEVLEKSDGRLGYVHIPGMSDGPYRSIYQDMMGKFFEKEGVIVDTRFNGGGDLVADLAMFFTGVPFITYATADKVVGGEPTSRWTKPTLSIFNEGMYSDGHCYAQGYTDLKIGTTVGMPVPGTCSFAGWESLPNGSYWGVVPVSAKNKAGEWMENNQTEPEIKIKNMPGVVDKGRDQQLERSIKELLEELE